MGYEIVFKYHDRLEEGGYDKEATKEIKKKIGEPFDDVSLEKLAGHIMAQLARRDIWVIDVDIFEYSKKKISFKETKGGIVVKNKKFTVDNDSNSLVVQDIMESGPTECAAPQTGIVKHPHELIQRQRPQQQMVPVQEQNNGKPKRWMLYLPSDMRLVKEYILKKGFKLTIEKKYPIFHESLNPNGVGMQLRTIDDNGREATIPDEFFAPAESNLLAGELFETNQNSSSDGLRWEGVVGGDGMNSGWNGHLR